VPLNKRVLDLVYDPHLEMTIVPTLSGGLSITCRK